MTLSLATTHRVRLISAIALLLPAACLADKSRCTAFKWVTDLDGSEKAAMVVSATINGQPVDLQFDTGSDVSLLYGEQQAGKLGLEIQQHRFGQKIAQALLAAGDIELADQAFHIVPYPPRRSGRADWYEIAARSHCADRLPQQPHLPVEQIGLPDGEKGNPASTSEDTFQPAVFNRQHQ